MNVAVLVGGHQKWMNLFLQAQAAFHAATVFRILVGNRQCSALSLDPGKGLEDARHQVLSLCLIVLVANDKLVITS